MPSARDGRGCAWSPSRDEATPTQPSPSLSSFVVSVAQLVERWTVAPVVVGSIPITHPICLRSRVRRIV